jgi:hypothetical protein
MAELETVFATRENFDERFSAEARGRFWTLVRDTVKKVFEADPGLADDYQRDMDCKASAWERIAVYHTSPLSIAADLAGWRQPIPDEKMLVFLNLQRDYAKQFDISLELPTDELRD